MSDDLNDPWRPKEDPWKAGKVDREHKRAKNAEFIKKAKRERAENEELAAKAREERGKNERTKNDELIIQARNPNKSSFPENELEKKAVFKFDWENWNSGGRIIFVAACVALLSMFMNWVDIGITTRIGVSQEAFMLLMLWIYPVVMLFRKKPISLLWGLLCASCSFFLTAIYIATKTVELFGETINVSAVGAWVFLFSSFALGIGVVKSKPGGFDDIEIKNIPRPLGNTLAILFGFLGFFLLRDWLFDREGDAPNIEVIAWFIFTVISVRLGIVSGLFGENALYSNRSAVVLTAKWFLIVALTSFAVFVLGEIVN